LRIVKYDLTPEAYGSNDKFVTKEGNVAYLIIDTGLLLHADFDKVIPKRDILNKMLLKGLSSRAGEWDPFEIDQLEYEELVKYLCSLPLPRPYRTYNNT
jgi:hypothetical protein